MSWTKTASGHEVALDEGVLRCRNSSGRLLKSVPASLKDDPVVVQLRQVAEWLTRHEASCLAQVETWMVRSLPVPLGLLTEVWPDESWQRALRDLVVRSSAGGELGLLRAVDAEKGIGLVTLEGDTVFVPAPEVEIPHPVLLADLDELREFVTDLGVEQTVSQLFREITPRPSGLRPRDTSLSDFSGGAFGELRFLTGRANSLGYAVRGGYASLRVWEGGRPLDARYWLGSDAPEGPAWTGELGWVDEASRPVPLTEVGPVAWSEGARMAARIFAGRTTEDEAA
ncbi:DUF4132 domain-containing protein [Kineosporia succinea]|uniref:DUF4132 domain-containing protein n=1 Tax=Kineosporia succinea TaxID=84632 RepID=A0ABT9P4I4_9ACTN|nr:DUF4132 domain-containing protein [Kineosporia succinea]MDP9827605.1 hypothetical protein [Kineosporia succinea]